VAGHQEKWMNEETRADHVRIAGGIIAITIVVLSVTFFVVAHL
jgi:hypothetical protein